MHLKINLCSSALLLEKACKTEMKNGGIASNWWINPDYYHYKSLEELLLCLPIVVYYGNDDMHLSFSFVI